MLISGNKIDFFGKKINKKTFIASKNINNVSNRASLDLKGRIQSDIVSFRSLTKPTVREKKLKKNIEQYLSQKLLNPIKTKVKDQSTLVRLSAFSAIRTLDKLQYNIEERKKLEKAREMALKDIQKFDNGKNIQGFIKELSNQGFKFYFANDLLPEELWTDEDFMESWNMDETDIDEQLEMALPLQVNQVLKTKGSAEIHYNRKDCKAMFLFNEQHPGPSSFWHEWFHYCQKKAGLFNSKINNNESAGTMFAKRELETYQFIIDNRQLLKLPASDIKLEIAIWNSYKDLYHYEKEYEETKKPVKLAPEAYSVHEFDLNKEAFTPFNTAYSPYLTQSIDIQEDNQRSILNRLIKKHNLNIEDFEKNE